MGAGGGDYICSANTMFVVSRESTNYEIGHVSGQIVSHYKADVIIIPELGEKTGTWDM